MKQVDDLAVGLKQEETSAEDCQVIIAFCPITSRVGTDIDAALNQITSRKALSDYSMKVTQQDVLVHIVE